jgi:hypothetical protein
MARLVVNPGSPAAWEIQLKPGTNLIGRGFSNDFKLTDPSVSGSHCQIVLTDGSAVIKDLGSTNGTFVNRAPVKEAALQPGQSIHLGGVELAFYLDSAGPETATDTVPPPVRPIPTAVRLPPPPTARPAATAHAAPPPVPTASVAATTTATGPCKSHPRTQGRFFCHQCGNFFCELCVTTRPVGGAPHKFCRHCGVECTPVQLRASRPAGPQGFFTRLPGAFIYPFRGSGLLVLIVSTVLLAAMDFIGSGLFSILSKIVALGYLFSYMQNIIHATANDEEQMPDLPGFDDVFGGAFRLVATVTLSFGLPIALAVMKFFFDMEVIPAEAIIGTVVLGCFYFPMAFLAVAMKDSVVAANPLVVMPAIFKVFAGYLITCVFVIGVFGMRWAGSFAMVFVKAQGYATRDMSTLLITFAVRAFWSLASVYLLTVSMRILGLLYLTNKHKLGWFDR